MKVSKDYANTIRGKLDNKHIGTWHDLTRFTNLTGTVVRTLNDKIGPELCTGAWAKMYEILDGFRLLPGPRVRSVHVCEAPGGFIAATNHYLRQQHGSELDWDWCGLTLNPYFEDNDNAAMVEDDKFILETFPHWYFGRDDSGNIMNAENIRGLWARMPGGVDLFTGDGSIDCQDNPNEQEMIVAQLHYCEVVCGLGMLRPGGAMVIKMFTLFEMPSITLLYLLNTLFDAFQVTKPATSKGGNAEVYLVAQGFRGIAPELLERLMDFVGPSLPAQVQFDGTVVRLSLIDLAVLPDTFLREAERCADTFARQFCTIIERNLDLDENGKSRLEDSVIKEKKFEVAREFIERYRLQSIPASQRIVQTTSVTNKTLNSGHVVSQAHGTQNWSGKHRGGATLEDRQRLREEHREERVLNHSTPASRMSCATSPAASPPAAIAEADGGPEDHPDGNGPDRKRFREDTAPDNSPAVGLALIDGAPASPAGEQDAANSVPTGSPVGPDSTMSFAERMMQRMGHVKGQGLGAQAQGIAAPIDPSRNAERLGLGYGGVSQAREDAPWHTSDLDEGLAIADSAASGDVAAWPIVQGQPLEAVSLSKFCRHDTHEALLKARRDVLGDLVSPQHELPLESTRLRAAFPACAVLSAAPAKVFTHPSDALSLSYIDLHCSLVLRADAFSVLDFHGLASGFGEAVAWQYRDSQITLIGVTDPADPAPAIPTWTAAYPKLSTAAVVAAVRHFGDFTAALDAIRASAARPVRLALVDASVRLASEVAGLGNSHVERHRKHSLLAQLRLSLSALEQGGSLVVHMADTLTRFTASSLYVLGLVFDKVQVLKPFTSLPFSPERFAVCIGFRGLPNALAAHLERTHERLDAAVQDGYDILSFVPMPLLLSPTFFRFLCFSTERLAARELAAIQACKAALDGPEETEAADQLAAETIARLPQLAVPVLVPVPAPVPSSLCQADAATGAMN
eukprot:m.111139 g.111139  ORF g.111139 m.111139 type:complete len:967 (+) comp9081_c0_seq2:644-3544(+)